MYKTVGSVGFLMGSVAAPLSLTLLNYDGTFGLFLGVYALLGLYSLYLMPKLGKESIKDEIEPLLHSELKSD